MQRTVIAVNCATAAMLVTGCTAAPPPQSAPSSGAVASQASAPVATTARIHDPAALERLKNNAGVTLQWISWTDRGTAWVREENGTLRLTATQSQVNGPGRLMLDGRVTEVDSDYFIFDGRISITDTPDAERNCTADRPDWHFAVTQNRPYWRLREFEWCDGLTDYIDIYFPGTRP